MVTVIDYLVNAVGNHVTGSSLRGFEHPFGIATIAYEAVKRGRRIAHPDCRHRR